MKYLLTKVGRTITHVKENKFTAKRLGKQTSHNNQNKTYSH